MTVPVPESPGAKFQRLVEIMARLRAPGGCPWDREQTFDSIKPYTLEETYEVMDAIDARDWDELAAELGDLLLQPVFYAQMAAEENRFRIEDCLDAIAGKLIRRHPHVFGDGSARTPDEVVHRWEQIKAEERREKGHIDDGMLSRVSRSQPALAEGQQIGSKVARAGFDWANPDQVLEKLREELAELNDARRGGSREEIAGELGDLLFVIVNLARHLEVDAEQSLRGASAKFRKRFGYLERRLTEQGRAVEGTPLEELESLWQEAKAQA